MTMPSTVETLAIGAGLGLSLAAPPGPILAKVAYEVSRGRRWTGFFVGFGASCADMTFFALVAFGILRVLPNHRVLGVLGLGGVVLMDFFAYAAYKGAHHPPETRDRGAPGFLGGFLLAATSPFNWLWWLTSGVPFVGLYGPLLGIGFWVAIVAWVVVVIAIFAFGSSKIARFEVYVGYTSAAMLFGFGLFLAYNSLRFLRG